MDYPRGECFFHYTTRDAAFEHILPKRALRLTPYSKMRDPLENKAWTFPGAYWVSNADGEPGEPGHPETAFAEFNWKMNLIKDGAKLLALTLDADDYEDPEARFARGWARQRMWELYGEKHQGVCLVFRRNRLIENLERSLADEGILYHDAVKYTEEGFVGAQEARQLNLGEFKGRDMTEAAAEHLRDHRDALFFLKTRDWQTEYEYRFVLIASGPEYVTADYGDALEAVIVGEQFPDWQRAGAVEACRAADADAVRVDWSMGRPFLGILRVKRPGDRPEEDLFERLQKPPPGDPPHPPAP